MSYRVLTTSDLKKDVKRLVKEYRSLKKDILILIASSEEKPFLPHVLIISVVFALFTFSD